MAAPALQAYSGPPPRGGRAFPFPGPNLRKEVTTVGRRVGAPRSVGRTPVVKRCATSARGERGWGRCCLTSLGRVGRCVERCGSYSNLGRGGPPPAVCALRPAALPQRREPLLIMGDAHGRMRDHTTAQITCQPAHVACVLPFPAKRVSVPA